MSHDKLAFIEEVGMVYAAQGLPPMAGRVLGALLVADPPEQTAEELAETLQASRGSISGMTRLLEGPGIIERVSKPGDRRVYYRNRPDAWSQAMLREARQFGVLRTLAEKGLALISAASPEVRRGLEDMRDFYAFWEGEIPKVLEHWQQERRRQGENRAIALDASAPEA